ncbi:TIR domain-containing protein [Lentzea sp. NPDC058436]|uniref:TIR domain-containing protein n=1 Tax=Lentzea sp. NPDC058436 TaxID=3346499 RepID=UPI003653B3DC
MSPININISDDPDQEWSSAFWSYVHRDNDALFGKIDMIREDLQSIYSLETGESLKIFVDREDLGWGEQWEESLLAGVGTSVFFIPVVTARYLNSEYCRTELLTFYSHCRARGLLDLILPIVLTGADKIKDDSTDEVARIIAKSQYVDFSEVWPRERGGEAWTTAIREMVRKLVAAEARVGPRLLAALEREVQQRSAVDVAQAGGSPGTSLSSISADDDGDDDDPGLLELAEELEPSMRASTEALGETMEKFQEVSEILSRFGAEVREANEDTQKYKLTLIRMAEAIRKPAEDFELLGSNALDKILSTDSLMKRLYSVLDSGFAGSMGSELKEQIVRSMGDMGGVVDSIDSLDKLVVMIADAEKISVITKKALRPARRGARYLRDAARTFASWSS